MPRKVNYPRLVDLVESAATKLCALEARHAVVIHKAGALNEKQEAAGEAANARFAEAVTALRAALPEAA